jgi:hypothetical protein
MLLLVVISLLAAGGLLGLYMSTYKESLVPMVWILFIATSLPVVRRWQQLTFKRRTPAHIPTQSRNERTPDPTHIKACDSLTRIKRVAEVTGPKQA